MIASVTGTLVEKNPTEVRIDVNGIGYAVSIPLSTFDSLGDLGSRVTLFTHLHVREDVLQLYGFASTSEKELFRLLISVSGIGPRMAQGILSGSSAASLREHLGRGDLDALTSLPGIGRKLAERLVMELREKITRLEVGPARERGNAAQQDQIYDEAVMALQSLGFTRQSAEKSIRQALGELKDHRGSVEDLIKAALRSTPR